jgi:ring-1,2-phenylacetyl-CoA epoxidase subunit PaaC
VSLHREAPPSPLGPEAFELLLALADDEFVAGHRHSEWLGLSPFLEEDLTLASIAQDELGHARSLYALIWPGWVERDADVVRRPEGEWRSCALVERDNGPWEDALMRHYLYDAAEVLRWEGLVERFGASVSGLESLAEKVLVEERFHRRHANDLVNRLSDVEEGRTRLSASFDRFANDLRPLTFGMSAAAELKFCDQMADVFDYGQRRRTSDGITGIAADGGVVWATPASRPGTDGRADGESRISRSAGFVSFGQSVVDVVRFDPDASW